MGQALQVGIDLEYGLEAKGQVDKVIRGTNATMDLWANIAAVAEWIFEKVPILFIAGLTLRMTLLHTKV